MKWLKHTLALYCGTYGTVGTYVGTYGTYGTVGTAALGSSQQALFPGTANNARPKEHAPLGVRRLR